MEDMVTPIGYDERKIYEDKILKDKSGIGYIYTGEHFTIEYHPARVNSHTLKCIGIKIVTRRKCDKSIESMVEIPFKQEPPGLFMRLLSPNMAHNMGLPFKDRLKTTIDEQVDIIKKKEAHIKAVEATAEKITMCQRKIDKTMSEFKVKE